MHKRQNRRVCVVATRLRRFIRATDGGIAASKEIDNYCKGNGARAISYVRLGRH